MSSASPAPSAPKRMSSVFSTRSLKEGGTTAAISPDELEVEEQPGDSEETGKFRQLLGILRKTLSVADLSSVRLSLPANLLEPLGNLEYWQYCERPDFFSAMAESDDELERMLAVLRWVFTKDLKFVKHKIAKPYNSILGEHFHCYWECDTISLHPIQGHPEVTQWVDENPTTEVLAAAGRPSKSTKPVPSRTQSAPTVPIVSVASSATSTSSTSAATTTSTAATSQQSQAPTRVVFLNEQTSHHPPISFFMLESRGPKGTIQARGADQLSAKFTGTAVRVFPGPRNHGIFITMPDRGGEEYQVTHPTAAVCGLIRANPYATILENCYVTCRGGSPKTRLRSIIAYTEESWLSKPKFHLEGVIYKTEEGKETEYTKLKHVPQDKVVATFEGCWRGEIRYKLAGEKTSKVLVDLVPLSVAPKTVAPLEEQHPLETRKVWQSVTSALHKKDWNGASKAKQNLEQEQRNKAEERKKAGETYEPAYFFLDGEDWDGRPKVTEAGQKEIEKCFEARYEAES